jgi:Tfp pilus assembly protein PilV
LKGFTLLEVVLACGLLGCVMLGLIALFLQLHAGSVKSANLTAGHYFAVERLQETLAPSAPWPPAGSRESGIYTLDAEKQTTFYHQVSVTALNPQSDYVQVRVWWWNGQRSGQGILSTSTGRVRFRP